jgi:hypothetical protein
MDTRAGRTQRAHCETMNIGNGIGVGLLLVTIASPQLREHSECQPGGRVLVDAHNAYPEEGRHGNRIARAIATGVPVAIEQDLVWCKGANGVYDVFVAHETTCRGDEPTLRNYFFESVKPLVEAALASGQKDDWPIVTLNLDFKMDPPDLHAAVWALLGEYRAWLTTAPRTATPDTPAPLEVGPILVLTGQADAQEARFHDAVPIGDRLLLFGAVHDAPPPSDAAAGDTPIPMPATNYRRWWNHPWQVVEPEGQPAAGVWTPIDSARLTHIVTAAHAACLWIRFYTLNGAPAGESGAQGWSPSYNFGLVEAAETRWRAARDAGVDFIATDQYEQLAAFLHTSRTRP